MKQYSNASLVEYREQWPWLKPWALALQGSRIVEVTSFPYDLDQEAYVMARAVVGDPTSNYEYRVSEIRDTGWSADRQRYYKEGFEDGHAAAVVAARKFRQEAK